MSIDKIIARGVRQHNLKNIDVEIPRGKFVVVTGISGSGKSSLAFDTIYAEGQRRYVESLSAYARQFLGQMDKPDVDYIEGLSPAVSIDQKTTSKNPRSTVATVTEVYDYMRLLFARIGVPHCPNCGDPISSQTVDQMVDQVLTLPEGTRLQVLAPVIRGRKGEHKKILADLQKQGYVRVRVDGEIKELAGEIELEKNIKHTIEVVVDRLIVRKGMGKRLADSLELALGLTGDLALVQPLEEAEEMVFSQEMACPRCGFSFEELSPRLFSFNNPFGACGHCTGLGFLMKVDPDLIIPDRQKSLAEGAILPWSRSHNYYPQLLEAAAKKYNFSTKTPVANLSEEALQVVLYGSDEPLRFQYINRYGRTRILDTVYEGVIPNLERRYRESRSEGARKGIERYMSTYPCHHCRGTRLRPEALAVLVGGLNIAAVSAMSIRDAYEFFKGLKLAEREALIARQILREIRERLGFLVNVGLDYLSLDRAAGTLAGGEAQRIRLATQIGSGLVGVLYVLDEPSIGLHQRDNQRLLDTLARLRDLGNTLIVVEHDRETIESADYIIDVGPGAGEEGGYLVAAGTKEDIMACPESLTGDYLSGRRTIAVPGIRREPNGNKLKIMGAREHNLKDIDVSLPLGIFICITGVSGSGKSTLINDILHRALAQKLHGARKRSGEHDRIEGVENLDKVIAIDQSPIGRTPRSNPATYTGVFDHIRQLYSQIPEAKVRGYKPGRFSFNVKGGRCEACRGDGIIKIEMHFLPDVYVPCEVCKGKRYNRETLEVQYKGKNIADILDMTVSEARQFFKNIPRINRRLQTLYDVGLGYIRLGQPATTLSGGEAQRVKLATELSRRSNGKTLYLLDEPTTGLHFADISRLLEVLGRLVEAGDTVVVIEHNLDVIKMADYIIDLGPEGGDGGGRIVARGTPEEVAQVPGSHTGKYLAEILDI